MHNYRLLVYLLLICSAALFASPSKKRQQQNHAPVVKITRPLPSTAPVLNAPIAYNITVSDKEDGDSKFGEINNKEVLLEVLYADGSAKASPGDENNSGLVLMRTSNCFNCHAFKSKGIGPSFYEIANKYAHTPADTAKAVAHRVQQGSVSIWGNTPMPKHPEFTEGQAQQIVDWILKGSSVPGIDYYIGANGTFKLAPPASAAQKGTYTLIATYLDHGIKNNTSIPRMQGSDTIQLGALH